MLYNSYDAPPCGLGWLQLVVSGVTTFWNILDSTNKAEAQKWAEGVAARTASADAKTSAEQAEKDAADKAALDEKTFKVLKVAGVVGAAAIAGVMLARRK